MTVFDCHVTSNMLVVYRLRVTVRAIHRDRLPAVRCGRQTVLQVFQLTLVSCPAEEGSPTAR